MRSTRQLGFGVMAALAACMPDPSGHVPVEAALACAALEIGAPCGFDGERGPLRGHCFVPPGEHTPACVPVRPPPAALAACNGREPGADCSFDAPRGPIVGRCDAPPDRPLACRPDDEGAQF